MAPAAFAGIKVKKIYFDSPGTDSTSNSSINGEWVAIKNTGNRAKNLRGWTLRDEANHVYRFGSFKLRSGRVVKVFSGKGSNTGSRRYWGSGWHLWNNDGDTAILKNRGGKVRSRCSYTSSSTAYKLC